MIATFFIGEYYYLFSVDKVGKRAVDSSVSSIKHELSNCPCKQLRHKAKNLISKYKFVDLSKGEIIAILGNPDFHQPIGLQYNTSYSDGTDETWTYIDEYIFLKFKAGVCILAVPHDSHFIIEKERLQPTKVKLLTTTSPVRARKLVAE